MAHNNTVLSQLLKLIPRHEFETLAKQHHCGRSFRTASRLSQCVVMMMAQLSGRNSLRDIVENISAQAHRLYHLGSSKLSRSNLSRINYVGLNHAGYLPEFVTITEGKQHDVIVGRTLNFPKGSIVVVDKGYNDYSWYKQLTDKGIFFVTRLKKDAKYYDISDRPILKNKGIISDQIITFTGKLTAKRCPVQLRRIAHKDKETGKHYVFLTNHLKLSARTIANIYKARWQVELFFKWIKQNLKIKSFVGTSKNAVMTQIWIALCVYILLVFIKFQSGLSKSMQQILRLLQLNLFEK